MAKTLFIDSTPDIDRVWRKVHGPKDIPIAVNMGPVAASDVPKTIAGYDTVINDATYFNEATLGLCSGLKHIVFLGTGAASFVDLDAAARLGIKVSTISGYGDTTVAEHAMGLVFAAARHIATMHGHGSCAAAGGRCRAWSSRARRWASSAWAASAARWPDSPRASGSRPIAFNRSAIADPPVPMVTLDELLARSDIVSLHLGLNDATRGFLGRARLEKTKPGVIVVNTARAGVVDEPALIDLLRSGHVGHYATDVFAKEPVPQDEPLLKLDNVTLTAHAGYNTPEAAMTMYRRAIDLAAAG